MKRIGILGATGKMGQWVCKLIDSEFSSQCSLAFAPKREAHFEPLLESDCVIDFSQPEATMHLLDLASKAKTPIPPMVIGTTGWTSQQRARIDEVAKKTHVVLSSNFSTGVLALQEILKQASPLLKRTGYTPVILETHHRHKKDAPSGTAILLQKTIAPENPSSVQTHSVRGGEVVGDHEVKYYGPSDVITISHHAGDRSIFARGAIQAALWLLDQKKAGRPAGRIVGMEEFFRERFLS